MPANEPPVRFGHKSFGICAVRLDSDNSGSAYLTQSEITKLENCNPFEGACVLASRCKLVGVKSLKESTKKVMTALLTCRGEAEDPKETASTDSLNMCELRLRTLRRPILLSVSL